MPPPIQGMNENVLANHFSAGNSRGARTNTPHNPYTTDGTAARRSMRIESGLRSPRGHSSLINSALATAIGTPITSAMVEVTIVPNSSAPPW